MERPVERTSIGTSTSTNREEHIQNEYERLFRNDRETFAKKYKRTKALRIPMLLSLSRSLPLPQTLLSSLSVMNRLRESDFVSLHGQWIVVMALVLTMTSFRFLIPMTRRKKRPERKEKKIEEEELDNSDKEITTATSPQDSKDSTNSTKKKMSTKKAMVNLVDVYVDTAHPTKAIDVAVAEPIVEDVVETEDVAAAVSQGATVTEKVTEDSQYGTQSCESKEFRNNSQALGGCTNTTSSTSSDVLHNSSQHNLVDLADESKADDYKYREHKTNSGLHNPPPQMKEVLKDNNTESSKPKNTDKKSDIPSPAPSNDGRCKIDNDDHAMKTANPFASISTVTATTTKSLSKSCGRPSHGNTSSNHPTLKSTESSGYSNNVNTTFGKMEGWKRSRDGCWKTGTDESCHRITATIPMPILKPSNPFLAWVVNREKARQEADQKSAKKRKKENRRREKARQEVAQKAHKVAKKKREAKINSWQSPVVTACSNADAQKVDGPVENSPFQTDNENAVKQVERKQEGSSSSITKSSKIQEKVDFLEQKERNGGHKRSPSPPVTTVEATKKFKSCNWNHQNVSSSSSGLEKNPITELWAEWNSSTLITQESRPRQTTRNGRWNGYGWDRHSGSTRTRRPAKSQLLQVCKKIKKEALKGWKKKELLSQQQTKTQPHTIIDVDKEDELDETQTSTAVPSSVSSLDPEVLAALPEDVRHEVMMAEDATNSQNEYAIFQASLSPALRHELSSELAFKEEEELLQQQQKLIHVHQWHKPNFSETKHSVDANANVNTPSVTTTTTHQPNKRQCLSSFRRNSKALSPNTALKLSCIQNDNCSSLNFNQPDVKSTTPLVPPPIQEQDVMRNHRSIHSAKLSLWKQPNEDNNLT